MSEYVYNTVTSYGAALIAQATAANPIVIVGALSKATAASSVSELATADASWYDGKTGSIATVSATDNVARIVAVFRNNGSLQAAKSIAVTARLASQTDGEAVVLAAISDPDSTIELPSADDTGHAVEFPINIAINPGGTVQTTPGSSASVADLDRFVSLHAPGQPTTGEGQSIYGPKTFNNVVVCLGGVSGTTANFTGESGFTILNSQIIYPSSGASTKVGTEDRKFDEVHAEELYGDEIHGCLPTPNVSATPTTVAPNIPIGAVVMLLIRNSSSMFSDTAAVYCGETIFSDGDTLLDGSSYDQLLVARLQFSADGLGIVGEQDSITPLASGMDFKVIIGCTNTTEVNSLRCVAMRIA